PAGVPLPVPALAPSDARDGAPPGPRLRARLAVLGASGYTGQEFARLALAHPGLDIVALGSREQAGRPVSEVLPGLDPRGGGPGRSGPIPTVVDLAEVESLVAAGAADTVVSCLPHGAWRALSAERPALAGRAARIVDLSSDFRDGSAGYVYGLPEAFRASIQGAPRVSNPGCYATAGTLALLPVAEAGWIAGPVMMSALSGVSGAGRSAQLRTSFVELDGGAALYKVGTEHAHVGEMERTLARVAGAPVAVGFAPQLAPMARGILLTANVPLKAPVSPEQARRAYHERYGDEPFVRVLDPDQWPETRTVRTSNRCDLAVTTLHGGRMLLVAAALDNLVKGAAGQALQNLNLMLGWPENWALPVHGSPW
ncbi:MAG TPA: N-acetyl-gamma-glutamyl-phosphate reductase, partial [Candidatus Eisenbacteria bacterium]